MPVPKGTRIGGRTKGTLNKRTVQKLNEASQHISEIKRQGRKRAVEVLDELMHTAVGAAASYQQRMLAAGDKAAAGDIELFWLAMKCAGDFAKALAPFQSPTFKAIAVTVGPPDQAVPAAANDLGRVTTDDPAVLLRIYQQTIKQIT
jgi:hypothetical protein